MPNTKAYTTKREIAEHFGVSTRTVDNWRASGFLPVPIKLGSEAQSRLRWPVEVLTSIAAAVQGGRTAS